MLARTASGSAPALILASDTATVPVEASITTADRGRTLLPSAASSLSSARATLRQGHGVELSLVANAGCTGFLSRMPARTSNIAGTRTGRSPVRPR